MRAIVFGATESAQSTYDDIRKDYEIVALTDNDKNKWEKYICGVFVVNPADIFNMEWDEVIIISVSAMEAIKKQLLGMGIQPCKINTRYVELNVIPRIRFCEDFAAIVYDKGMMGSVAEAGVFQGEFAAVINRSFPDRKLFLFDTFEGFDKRDILYEERNHYSNSKEGHLSITSEELVLSKMPYPGKCVIKKGYFPESACDVDEKFCFVNLDMDLYKPTLEGLRFFYPSMIRGGY